MTTRVELVTRVKQLLRDPAAVGNVASFAFTDAEIIEALEESRNEIQGAIAVRFPDRVSARATMTYTADERSMALPSTTPDLTFATISTVRTRGTSSTTEEDYRQLRIINMAEGLNMATNGLPVACVIQNANIWLFPRPDTGQALEIQYVPAVTAFTVDGSIPTELPSRYHHLLAWDAAVSLQEQSGDDSPLARRRDAIMAKLMEFMSNLAPDSGLEGAF